MSLPPSGPPYPPEPDPSRLPEPEAPVERTSALPPVEPKFGPRPYETGQQPQYVQPAYDPYARPQPAQPQAFDPFGTTVQPAAQPAYGGPSSDTQAYDPRAYEPPAADQGRDAAPQYGQYAQPQYAQPQYARPEQPQHPQDAPPQYARPDERPHYGGQVYEQPYAAPQQDARYQEQQYDDQQYDDRYAQQYGQQYDQAYPQQDDQQYAQPRYDQYDQTYAEPYPPQQAPQYDPYARPDQQYYGQDQYGGQYADPYAAQGQGYDYGRGQSFADPFPVGGALPQYPPADPRRPQKTGTNGFAIAGFVFSIVGGLLFSVVFSIIGLRQIKRDGGKGRGLAITALVLSGLWVVGIGTVVVLGLLGSADRGASGEVVAAGDVALTDLRVGDCVEKWSESDSVTSVRVTPCTNAHDAQVVSADALSEGKGAAYPGDAALDEQASAACTKTVKALDQAKLPDSGLSVAYFRPLADSWKQGDRTVTCLVVADSPMTGSVLS